MNLLLLDDPDFLPDGATVRLTGRRLKHAREILKVGPGDAVRVGRVGGLTGEGRVVTSTPSELVLSVSLVEPPPPRAEIDLLLAIPRPKALKKVLPAVASLGIDRVVLLNAARVEKSYFDSKVLDPAFVHELLVQGLEQARDTRCPEVLVRERFRPFVEDELDERFGHAAVRLVADPRGERPLGSLQPPAEGRILLAIGPEGGWVPFELELLTGRGFTSVSAGPRPLRVEVAVPYLLGALSMLRP